MDLPDFGKKIYLHNIFVCLFIYLFMKALSVSMWCIRQDHAVSALQSKLCTQVHLGPLTTLALHNTESFVSI